MRKAMTMEAGQSALGRSLELLQRAAELYDGEGSPFPAMSANAWRGGFQSGGAWMGEALAYLRGRPTKVAAEQIRFQRLGIIKYALCLRFGGYAVIVSLLLGLSWFVAFLAFAAAFYAVEVQMVFLFPVLLDGSATPFRDARGLMQRSGGTVSAVATVLPLAAVMLLGGLCGKGFVRSWCLGCLAVVLWYVEVRGEEEEDFDHGGGKLRQRFPYSLRHVCPLWLTSPLRKILRPGTPRVEFLSRGKLTVRQETVNVSSHSPAAQILYISDLHLGSGSSKRLVNDLVEVATTLRPGLILLGGDLADRRSSLPLLSQLTQRLVEVAPTAAIPGNHDRWPGEERVRACIQAAGGTWLPDGPLTLPHLNLVVSDHGGIDWPADFTRVICAHYPDDFDQPASADARIMFAGHLHGGQCVLKQSGQALFPGRLFSRWNVLRHERNQSTLIVSRGVNDTLPIRFNCPREVILCQLM